MNRESRLALYVVIGILSPIFVLLTMVIFLDPFSGFAGSPQTASKLQRTLMRPVFLLLLLSPILAPLFAYFYFLYRDAQDYKKNKGSISAVEHAKTKSSLRTSRRNQFIILVAIIVVAFALIQLRKVAYSILEPKPEPVSFSEEHNAATDRGCVQAGTTGEILDDKRKLELKILQNYELWYGKQGLRQDINNTFDECRGQKITPDQQKELIITAIDEYQPAVVSNPSNPDYPLSNFADENDLAYYREQYKKYLSEQ